LEKKYTFAVDDIQRIQADDYAEDEFCLARLGFLSTRPNAHGLIISEEVLRESAPTILNKWLVADMTAVYDASTHTDREQIVGRIPDNQEVEFVEDEDGYLRAYADVVISKIYAKNFCEMFERNNNRSVSVEMVTWGTEENENDLVGFRIVGCTVLGQSVSPSCPQSDITFTRFSAEEADSFFEQAIGGLTDLTKFVNERKRAMADKSYKVDKSKEAMSDDDWGSVDKTSMRNKIMDASNKSSLVKSVYALVESGWEESPSEHLKYPIMQLKGDTFVYNRNALSSALGYAKKEEETAVVSKIEKIYKKLGLDSEGKEEKKMSKEIKFAAVDLGDMWGALRSAMSEHSWYYYINSIYEEDNQKFAIIVDDNDDVAKKYRLDFNYTEDGLTVADEITEVKVDFIPTENIKKFAEPENAEEVKKCAKPDKKEGDDNDDDDDNGDGAEPAKMSVEEMEKKLAELQADVEEKENIIMEKDKKLSEQEAELSDLREFKAGIEKESLSKDVEKVMADVKDFIDNTKFAELREEGLACDTTNFDAWSNKVKATCFSAIQKKGLKKQTNTVWSFSAPTETESNVPTDFWSQMKSKYN
jgi:hypothetical protein